MKKLILTFLMSTLFLVGCGSKNDSTRTSKSTTSQSNISTESTSSITHSISTQSSTTSEIINQQSSQESATIIIDTEEKAIQRIIETQGFENNDDISFQLLEKIENDYLFQAQSKSILKQGGSGTVGFYRVTPDGVVTLTNSQGNP